MSAHFPTHPVLFRDAALNKKRDLRTGMAVLHISVPMLARELGVEDDQVEAWVSETRANHVPACIEDMPGLPRALRDWMRSASDRRYGERIHGAETPEAQAAVVLLTMGQMLTVTAAVIPVDHIGHELAAQLIVIGERLVTALCAWLARLRQRVITRGHGAAGRSS
jgi:hypothetical protein